MKKKKILSEIVAALLCIALLFTVSLHLGNVYIPERYDYGALWNMFKCEDENSVDAIFLGSSLTYCDIIPSVIYEKTGCPTYVLAGPEMTVPISYYYLNSAFETQSPAVVMLEATGMFFKEYTDYTKVNLGYLPFSANRIEATFSAAEPEERFGLLFPLYNYHTRWETTDFSRYFGDRRDEKVDPLAGYTYLTKITEFDSRVEREMEFDEASFEKNCEYLEKMKALCAENGAELMLFISPVIRYLPDGLYKKLTDIAKSQDIVLIDFNDIADTCGIDIKTDYYDTLHLNVTGAVKLSGYIADYLSPKLGKSTFDKELWDGRVGYFNKKLSEE